MRWVCGFSMTSLPTYPNRTQHVTSLKILSLCISILFLLIFLSSSCFFSTSTGERAFMLGKGCLWNFIRPKKYCFLHLYHSQFSIIIKSLTLLVKLYFFLSYSDFHYNLADVVYCKTLLIICRLREYMYNKI